MLHVRLTTLVKVLFLFMAALHLIWAELSMAMAMAMAMNGCQRPDKPQYPAIKEMESPGIQLRSRSKYLPIHSTRIIYFRATLSHLKVHKQGKFFNPSPLHVVSLTLTDPVS